ncbi:MAG: signal peptide peptidase SppA [Deferribacteraceae bacterium]|jgi:protease-4|nr:signal peptide peptidase SppA [Deferribacteraceae bacterium]
MNIVKRSFQWLVVLMMVVLFVRGVVAIFGGYEYAADEDYIAVLDLNGVIFDAETTIEKFRKLEDDDYAKGYVLRINSPGGLVTPSQAIYEYLLTIKKPLYVAMGSTAASGGYMAALPANRIYAMPTTITGSIGVIMQVPNYSGLYDKIGISEQVIKSGLYKDAGNPSRPMTDEDQAVLSAIVMDMYDQFVQAVSSRRNLTDNETRTLADGRIYTGRMAMSHGLVDRMGSWYDVYLEMAKDLGTPDIKYHEIHDEVLPMWKRVMTEAEDIIPTSGLNPAGFYYMLEY